MAGDFAMSADGLGSAEHQRLLRAMTLYIAAQSWTRAFLVFGSVARGDWDNHSDLDLNVVITDDAALNPTAEAARMCAAIGERAALIAPRHGDSAEVILESLAQFSIRYHRLATTSPNILDSMRLLWGKLTLDQICGVEHNHPEPVSEVGELASLAIRALLYVQIGLARGQPWRALASLDEARELLLELYARARDLPRPLPAFERDPDASLRAALAPLTATLDPAAIRAALLAGCDLLLSDYPRRLSNGQVALTPGERHILTELRARLT
jgi:hypothetical protein